MSNKSTSTSQTISLPKGGGALSSLGEKFTPDLHTGTGNFSFPLTLPPGRNGFQPQLNLAYTTGSGNGPFGLGWNLSVPGIVRKTSHGIPRYNEDATGREPLTDVFLLSGAEDLVKVSGNYPGRVRYGPRTEGLFARIEHVRDETENYWDVRTKDGLISRYGTKRGTAIELTENDPAVAADPTSENRARIFCWKLTETRDVFGNLIVYEYLRDSGSERAHLWDQPLLHRIKYGDYDDRGKPSFLVQVEFGYEPRPDPFSEYRSGFEIRTTLRCHRILITTHTADGVVHQVREFRLLYEQAPHNGLSLLTGIELFGFDDEGVRSARPILPPLTYGYSSFEPARRQFKAVEGQALPLQAVSDPDVDLVDLHGNGLPDLIEMKGVVRYWRNLGDGHFDWPRMVANAPAHRLSDPGVQFIDSNGDGRTDLLVTTAPVIGNYPMNHAPAWDRKSFQPYAQAPTVNFEDPEVRLLDLDGDGITDVLRSGSRFECFFNDRDPQRAWRRTAFIERQDLEHFPNVNFSDPRVRLVDMNGDGLQDIVAIHDGRIEYWPNLGHGRWGRRISMRHSPRLPFGYEPRHILLGDVDGDGLADLIYVDNTRVLLWINQSGNAWGHEPIIISGTPPMTSTHTVRVIDLEGSGVSGILWSRTTTESTHSHMRFLDFTGGSKPYLLNRMTDNMGAETRVEYRPSTHDYLRDQKQSTSGWSTTLPFPVQVVARVEVIDHLSRGKLTTEYHYHHGYWDGAEREFRGFGMVEQFDTETFETYNAHGLHGPDIAFEGFNSPGRQKQFSPPTLIKSWFHQGPVGDEFGDWKEPDYSLQFWPGDPPALFRSTKFAEWLDQLPRRVRRDALRTLRGSLLRTEFYALDGTEREDRPYTVTEAVYGVREESIAEVPTPSRHRIFFPFAIAQRSTQWERGDDPMTQLSFVGDYDAYGQPRKQMAIAVPRGRNYRVESGRTDSYLATLSETVYAQRDDVDHYMVDRGARLASYEVINDGRATPFQLWELVQVGQATLSLTGLGLQYYDGAAFEGLPLKQLHDYGALVRSESLVMTEEILRAAYRTGGDPPVVDNLPPYLNPNGPPGWTDEYPAEFRSLMPNLAGYVYRRGGGDSPYVTGYYVIGERRRYDFHQPDGKGRGLVTVARDPLGRDATVRYDAHGLLPIEAVDPVGLTITARYNYRVLQPESVTDENGNTARVTFTPSGLVAASYVQGKAGEGDQKRPSASLEYDLLAFMERGQPVSVRTITHIHHDTETDVPESQRHETIESIEYSDGFGRLLQARAQAEDVLFGDSIFGEGALPVDLSVVPGDAVGRERQSGHPPNVVVSGWQVYDNKGRVVEKYEPFYAQSWDYAPPVEAQLGRKVETFYDPRGQVIRTVNPDGSEQQVIYGIPEDLTDPTVFTPTPWEAYTYDVNDNAGRTNAETSAGYVTHWNTPSSIVIDPLGRTISAIVRNGHQPTQDWYTTRSAYDIRGNLLTVTDPLGRVAFSHVYDLANRPLRIDSIDAGVRRIVLDVLGNEVERRDSKGALILQITDPLNRPSRLWARDEDASRTTLREILVYGDGGDVDQAEAEREANRVANRLGKLFQYYDEAGRQTLEVYDFKGNVIEKVRHVIGDAPILTVFDAAPANAWRVSAFRIDWQPEAGETLAHRAQSLLDPTEYRTSFQLDALNRAKVMQYPRDVEGRRRSLKPQYNRAGGLEQVKLDDAVYVERIVYNAKGQRTLIAYGNGVMTRYAYDLFNFRLRRLRSERYSQPQPLTYRPTGSALQDFGYDYDLAGNITVIQDRAPESGILNNPQAATIKDPVLAQLLSSGNALIRQFEYDPIYRLLSATGRECDLPSENPPWTDHPRCTDLTRTRGYTERYRYDPLGNLLRLQHQNGSGGFTRELSVATGSNRLRTLKVGDNTVYGYAYDAGGNMTAEATSRHFEWDHSDQLRSFRTQTEGAAPSIHAHYLYDAAGQRVKKLVRKQGGQIEVTHYIDGVFEHHRWGGQSEVGENNHVHVMDDQQRIALVRIGSGHPDDRGPALQFQMADHLGSSNIAVDSSGAFINREEFTPYGETSFGGFARKRFRFTGKERDEESGLTYHGARYYAAALVRWISADPIGATSGLNLYRFVANNPISRVDPEGTDDHEAMAIAGQLQEVATDLNVRKLPGETPSAYGTRMHKDFQNITHSLLPFGPNGRVVTEIVVDSSGRIRAFGGGPTDATNLSRNLGKDMHTADLVVLKQGMTASAKSLINQRLQDVALAGIDYKTGDARLSKSQTGLFKKLNIPLARLSANGQHLSDFMAGTIASRTAIGGGGGNGRAGAGRSGPAVQTPTGGLKVIMQLYKFMRTYMAVGNALSVRSELHEWMAQDRPEWLPYDKPIPLRRNVDVDDARSLFIKSKRDTGYTVTNTKNGIIYRNRAGDIVNKAEATKAMKPLCSTCVES